MLLNVYPTNVLYHDLSFFSGGGATIREGIFIRRNMVLPKTQFWGI